MKKSRMILRFRVICVFVLFFGILNVLFHFNVFPQSKYDDDTSSINGVVVGCSFNDYGYQLKVKGKEMVLVNYYDDFSCKLGIKIKAEGTIDVPSENTVFNLFNYRNYLLSQKINYVFKADEIEIVDDDIGVFYGFKNMLQRRVDSYSSKDYLNAFILGSTKYIDDGVMESYRDNGISHLLAISGMHITLISMGLLFLLGILCKNKRLNYFIVIGVLIFYMFVTNFTPSVVRASLMFILLTVKNIFNLKIVTIYLLFLVAGGYLIYNPYMIYHIGFLFSFVVTFYLILFSDLIGKQSNYFKKTFVISLIAFLAGMPIQIYNFFTINLLSPFINVFFVPLVCFVIYPLSILCLFFDCLDGVFLFCVSLMENISFYVDDFGFNLVLSRLSFFALIFYYLIITYVLVCFRKKRLRGCFLLVLVLIIHVNCFNKSGFVSFIDVGQGDCALVSNGYNVLIDTGGKVSYNGVEYNMAKNKIIPYLNSLGISSLDYLILTHGDYDHMGEAVNFVNDFSVKNVIFNCGEFNDLEKDLIKVLNKKHIPYYSCVSELNLSDNFYFLNDGGYDDENDNSSVIYTVLNGYGFLFMGDAGTNVEESLIDEYDLSGISVLKVGHHGSKTSSSKNFIDFVDPMYSVISVGKNNRYGHPNFSVLDNLEGSKVFRTDVDGSIRFDFNNKLRFDTCLSN